MSLHYLYTMLLHYTVYSRRILDSRRSSRREQAPALRCNHIITQIGRENNISAEICKHPYEKERKEVGFFIILSVPQALTFFLLWAREYDQRQTPRPYYHTLPGRSCGRAKALSCLRIYEHQLSL